MKKIYICFTIVILSAIIFSGCGNKTIVSETAKTKTEYTTEKTTETVEVTEIIQETETEKKEPESIDYENAVTDAFSYEHKNEEGEFKYRIPKINLSGDNFSKINDEIYEIYSSNNGYDDIETYVEEIENGEFPLVYEIDYSWGVKDDVLSIVIEHRISNNGLKSYDVYNLDINDGTEISDEQIVALSGLTVDEYNEKSQQAVGSYFWNNLTYDGIFNSEGGVASFNDSLKRSLSSEYIDRRTPYFNNNQELCIIVAYRPLAGSDTDFVNLNLENFELVADYNREAELLPNENKLISQDEAYEIACEYYKNEYGIVSGDKDEEMGYEYCVRYKSYHEDTNKYLVTLDWLVEGHWSTVDYIYVDAETGECTPYNN